MKEKSQELSDNWTFSSDDGSLRTERKAGIIVEREGTTDLDSPLRSEEEESLQLN